MFWKKKTQWAHETGSGASMFSRAPVIGWPSTSLAACSAWRGSSSITESSAVSSPSAERANARSSGP